MGAMTPLEGGCDVARLDHHVLPGLRAFNLSTISQAVTICLRNSLEAGSREIHVDIDVPARTFKMSDDGVGLRGEDLALLGTWNMTSKSDRELATSGSRGEGLSAICSTAVVELTSRATDCFETHSCVLREGALLQLKLAPEQRSRSGTSVTVRDIFFNRPVVQKAMAAEGPKKEVDRCRTAIDRFALLRPDVTFTLYDRHRRIFITKHIRGRSQEEAVREFFGGLLGDDVALLAATRPPWSVSGWAVRPPIGHPSAARQCIYFNGQLATAPEIVEVVEDLYSEVYRLNVKIQRRTGELQSVRKASNLHPMFVLNLYDVRGGAEVLSEAGERVLYAGNWAPLIEAVKAALVTAWRPVLGCSLLASAGAVVSEMPSYGNSYNPYNSAGPPLPSTASHGGNNNSAGLKRKAARSAGANYSTTTTYRVHDVKRPSSAGAYTGSRQLSRAFLTEDIPPLRPSSASREGRHLASQRSALSLRGLEVLSSSSQPAFINTVSPDASTLAAWQKRRGASSSLRPTSSSLSKSSNFPPNSSAPSSALDSILKAWTNPAMMPSAATGTFESVPSLAALEAAVFAQLRPQALVREDLQGCRALAQVDTKFIPIVSPNGILALVDQHAADERVCLERLKAQVAGENGGPSGGACASMQLPDPQPLRLAADETPLLEAYSSAAAAWGWRWEWYSVGQCGVTHVPLVAHRALTSTDLRLYLHHMAETGGAAGPPEAVIRVLNSKACRGAIMFGDELTPCRAQKLVDELQETRMCFICAHGRPTTVPLVDLKALRKAAAVQAVRAAAATMPDQRVRPLGSLKQRLIDALKT